MIRIVLLFTIPFVVILTFLEIVMAHLTRKHFHERWFGRGAA